jgi:hypothetical protein
VLQDALELTIASEPTMSSRPKRSRCLSSPNLLTNLPEAGPTELRPIGTAASSPNGVPIPYDVAIVAGHIVKIFSNLSW